MKTAVSIPDDVFRAADRLAKRLKRSRSALYADALREYLLRRDPKRITESWNKVAHLLSTPLEQAWLRHSAEMMRRVEW